MKKTIIGILFWLHAVILAALIVPFFIPSSVWPEKVAIHFFFWSFILLLQLLWGAILIPKTKKIEFICPLTTLMQYLREYPVKNPKNYSHSFMAEFLEKIGIRVSFLGVTLIQAMMFSIVTIQYLIQYGK